jgi:hypothetical protein
VGRIFKLRRSSRAILCEDDQRRVITIPARAMVVLVGGDINEDIFVKIRFEGKVLQMLSEDLRSNAEPWDDRRSSLTEKATTRRATIKVSPEVLDWLKEEQYRRWKRTGKEPTQNELIREMIEIARRPGRLLEFHSNATDSPQLSEETRKYIQMLISVLESGLNEAITAVQHNLQIFYKHMGGDLEHARPMGKSHPALVWKDLEDLKQVREHIQHLTRIYLRQQMEVLDNAQRKSKLHTAALIVSFLKSGAALRRGPQGWEIKEAGMLLPCETVDELYKLGIVRSESDLEHDQERPGEFIHDLLSNQGIEHLDRISRRAFRGNMNRAYFEYLGQLLELYQEHSTLREGAISYPALVREKIRFAYHFAWLYVAGILHFFGITEQFRTRTAQCSLEAIGSLMG